MSNITDSLVAGFSSGLSQSVAGGSTGLIGQIFANANARRQWKYQQKQMALEQKYALEQMEKQYELNQMSFDRQNEYNLPTNVFSRFRDAGITPAGVLGSSGANVGATLIGTSSSSVAGSPKGGTSYMSPVNMSYDALVSAQLRNIDSQTNRNNADAVRIKGETHTEDWRKRKDELELLAGDLSNLSSAERLEIMKVERSILSSEDYILSMTKDFKIEDVSLQLDILRDNAEILRSQKPSLSKQAEATYLSTLAVAGYYDELSESEGLSQEINSVVLSDLRNAFVQQWDKKREVKIYDDKGNVTGIVDMSLADMYAYLTKKDVEASSYLPSYSRYKMRSEKNALGYSVVKSLVGILSFLGGARLGASSKSPANSTTRRTVDRFDDKGAYKGYEVINEKRIFED